MREYEITRFSVCVPLTRDEFAKLKDDDPAYYLDVVMPRLQKRGAMDIEYNGHFGANIFFSVDTQEEIVGVIDELESLLTEN